MTKKRHIGNITKGFILILLVINICMLSACSLTQSSEEMKEAIKYFADDVQKLTPTPSSSPTVAQGPTPAVSRDENQPSAGPNREVGEEADQSSPPEAGSNVQVTIIPEPTTTSESATKLKPTDVPEPGAASVPMATPKPTSTPKPKTTPKPAKGTKPAANQKPTVTPKPAKDYSTGVTPLPSGKESTGTEAYVDEILKRIITKKMTDVEKIKAVHDYIVLHTAYYENPRLKPEDYPAEVFTIEGVLLKGEAVCQGYAETFQLFMEKLGISSRVVVGKDLIDLVGHAWNMVSLDGKWYHVDVTWDDPVPDQPDRVQYKYFLVTDEILSVDHSWNRKDYPACDSTDYLYYTYEDHIIDSINDYEEKFIELYRQGERTITILYPEEGKPDLNFFYNYDFLHKVDKDGTKRIAYKHYQPWRRGDYSVYTVIVD